jgi:hypothetical protein
MLGPWCLTLTVSVLSASTCFAEFTEQHVWTFDDRPPGKLPPDFSERGNRGPHWAVIETEKAVSRPNVLATGKPYRATRHPTLILANQRTGEEDFELAVSFLTATHNAGVASGLIWRAQDEQNYYLFQVSPLGKNNLALYRVVNGVRSQLDVATRPFDQREWHTLWVVVLDDRFVGTFDGRPVLDARDPQFRKGRFGLWSSGAGFTYFDNLNLKKLK